MHIDHELLMSEDQAITASAADSISIDLVAAGVSGLGLGEPVKILCQVTEDFSGTTGERLYVTIQQDDNSSFSSPTTLATSETAATTLLKAGYQFTLAEVKPTERYIRPYYTVATTDFSAGKMTAGIVGSQQTNDSTFTSIGTEKV